MALLELSFADAKQLADEGRNFNCATCPESVQRLRRCNEPRWDFTEKDNPSVFPIRLTKGGDLYGFCPAKAARDAESVRLFHLLMISADTGAMLRSGGLEDQPSWYVDLLGWFIPRMDMAKFSCKAQMVLGNGGKEKAAALVGGNQRGSHKR